MGYGPPGVDIKNPFVHSPYNADYEEGIIVPGSPQILTTESGIKLTTESGQLLVTEG